MELNVSKNVDECLVTSENETRKELLKVNVNKAKGSDGLTSKILKTFASQLCHIYSDIFNLSLPTSSNLPINRNAYCRILLIDFSSVFNTIQPHIVVKKLNTFNVKHIIARALELLSNRLKYVSFNENSSNVLVTKLIPVPLKAVLSLLYCSPSIQMTAVVILPPLTLY